jgi:hypothetical protein
VSNRGNSAIAQTLAKPVPANNNQCFAVLGTSDRLANLFTSIHDSPGHLKIKQNRIIKKIKMFYDSLLKSKYSGRSMSK